MTVRQSKAPGGFAAVEFSLNEHSSRSLQSDFNMSIIAIINTQKLLKKIYSSSISFNWNFNADSQSALAY